VDGDDGVGGGSSDIHIRIQARTGRKYWTTIEGLAPNADHARILRALKKHLNTNGTVVKDAALGNVIQLQGDQRKAVYEALVEWGVCTKGDMSVHG
jgi:translation initiation factor 1